MKHAVTALIVTLVFSVCARADFRITLKGGKKITAIGIVEKDNKIEYFNKDGKVQRSIPKDKISRIDILPSEPTTRAPGDKPAAPDATILSGSERSLVIESWRWANMGDFNSLRIEGVVRNKSDKAFESAVVYLVAKDGNGELLGVGETQVRPLPLRPGQMAIFTALVSDAVCETDTLSIAYRFQAN